MRAMPGSGLLWVNTDVKSYKRSKRVSVAEASAINSHSQLQARTTKACLSQRALRGSLVTTAIFGWKRRSATADDGSSSGSSQCQSAEHNTSNYDDAKAPDAFALKPDWSPRIVPRISGKDEALDPFDCAAAKVDSCMNDIIQFYLARIHPTSWTAKAYASARLGVDYEALEIVQGCRADRARLYSLVSCTAAYIERAEPSVWKRKIPPSTFYLHNAIAAVRARVQSKDKESFGSDLLHTIGIMAVCAQFLHDYAASLAHLRAAKLLIEQRSGFAAVESGILRTIVRADLGRAVATLEAPVLNCPTKPTTVVLPNAACDAELERQADHALLLTARAPLPEQLGQYIHHLIKCTKMLGYAWTNRDCSGPIVGKVLSTIIALLYYLLSASFQSNTDSNLYNMKKLEAMRITLLLWTLLLTRCTRDGQHTYRDIPYDYEFNVVDPEVQTRLQFSDLYDLLMDWNQATQILNQSSNTKSKGIPPNLICIVQAMEAKTEVKLGWLMERVFELEELHRASSLNKQFDPSRRCKAWRKEAWPSVYAFNAFLIR
jgi:hypothetical protein